MLYVKLCHEKRYFNYFLTFMLVITLYIQCLLVRNLSSVARNKIILQQSLPLKAPSAETKATIFGT